MSILTITRHTEPTKFDAAPFATICKVIGDNDTAKYFIQVGTDDEPQWITLAQWLFIAFQDQIFNQQFFDETLDSYLNNIKTGTD